MVRENVYIPQQTEEKRPVEFIEYVFRFIIGGLFGALIGWLPAYRVYPIAYGSIVRIITFAVLGGIVIVVVEEYLWRIVDGLTRSGKRGNCWNPKI